MERSSFRIDLSTKLGREILSRNLREKRSEEVKSGFRKRGRRNGVASDFLPFSSVFFRFLPFFPCFLSVFFRFFLFHFQKRTGRHRSRDPFPETPIKIRLMVHSAAVHFDGVQRATHKGELPFFYQAQTKVRFDGALRWSGV